MSNIVLAQATKLAQTLGMSGEGNDLIATLKATAFKGPVTDSQMAALLIVANQYGLSPWTKEIYAFPDKNNGIVPVVGLDGWSRIINSHPQYDGVDFEQDADSCTCIIHRKDRGHPTRVTEYMVECKRAGAGPWSSHPYRMLRHKALIQCARLAFGFVGIYDQDEAERIVGTPAEKFMGAAEIVPPAAATLPTWPDDKFADRLPLWKEAITSGKKTVEGVIAFALSKGALTDGQMAAIKALPAQIMKEAKPREPEGRTGPAVSFATVADAMRKAPDFDALTDAGNLIDAIADKDQQAELNIMFSQCAEALN